MFFSPPPSAYPSAFPSTSTPTSPSALPLPLYSPLLLPLPLYLPFFPPLPLPNPRLYSHLSICLFLCPTYITVHTIFHDISCAFTCIMPHWLAHQLGSFIQQDFFTPTDDQNPSELETATIHYALSDAAGNGKLRESVSRSLPAEPEPSRLTPSRTKSGLRTRNSLQSDMKGRVSTLLSRSRTPLGSRANTVIGKQYVTHN